MPFNRIKNETIKNEIFSSVRNKLIPFIGAGFSTNIKGYPSFYDFVNEIIAKRLCIILEMPLSDKLDLYDIFNNNPNEAIEYFIYTVGKKFKSERQEIFDYGKNEFHEEVKSEFKKVERLLIHGNKDEWIQHINLVDKFKTIYTTNWDHAIEKACEYQKYGYEKYYHNSQVLKKKTFKGTNGNTIKLIKYHGDFISCNSLIACETDYFHRITMNNHPLDLEFKKHLSSRNFMFLGYSISDINVKYIINSTSRWREAFSDDYKYQFFISVDDPNKVHEEKIKFLEEWVGIKTYFLLSGHSDDTQKKTAIRNFIANL